MPEMRTGYHPDHRSFAAFMMSSTVMRWALEGAYEVQRIAAATTRRSGDAGPHLADNYLVQPLPQGVVVGKERNRRAAARVENNLSYAAAHEFGTAQQRGYRDLGRAGARVGDFRGLESE